MMLAPVVRERKGVRRLLRRHADPGLRALSHRRRDGRGSTSCRSSTKRKSTRIDVVVDRLKVRADAKQRLAESFETALRLADGRALLLDTRQRAGDRFSSRFACPMCSYSLRRAGAAPVLLQQPDGRMRQPATASARSNIFDEKRVVAHPELALASGAIKGWDARNQYYHQMLVDGRAALWLRPEPAVRRAAGVGAAVILHGSGEDDDPVHLHQ